MSNFVVPRFRIQDALGNAIVGGHIHFYAPSTTTPKNTYQDAALTVPNTNPVVSGSDGWTTEIWMLAEPYKIVIEDASGNVLNTYDPYYPADTDEGGAVDVSSSSSAPAVKGTNSSSGPAGQFVNSGTGPAVVATADTSSPVSAALRVTPQDSFPSSPVRGDLVLRTSGGIISVYDGTRENRLSRLLFADSGGSVSVGTSLTLFSTASAIPIGYLSGNGLVKIRASVQITAQVGGPAIDAYLFFGNGGGPIVSKTIAVVAANDSFLLEADVYCDGPYAQICDARAFVGSATGAVVAPTVTWSTGAVNNVTTSIVAAVGVMRTGGTSATALLRKLFVEVT